MDEDHLIRALAKYRSTGYTLFIGALLLGIVGAIAWSWLAILIAIIAGLAIGQMYAQKFYSDLSLKTGLDKKELKSMLATLNNMRRGQ